MTQWDIWQKNVHLEENVKPHGFYARLTHFCNQTQHSKKGSQRKSDPFLLLLVMRLGSGGKEGNKRGFIQ